MNNYSPAQITKLEEIGTHLKQQREKRSLSLDEIAQVTFVSLPVLEALESGSTDHLPELVYVRGFIRRYCEQLGLESSSLLESLAKAAPLTVEVSNVPQGTSQSVFSEKKALTSPASSEKFSQAISSIPKWGWGVIIIALFGLMGISGLWLSLRNSVPQTQTEEEVNNE